jgi:hypothetical protein
MDSNMLLITRTLADKSSPHRRPIRQEAVRQEPNAHCRATRQRPHDERPKQRKEDHGCPNCSARFRDHPPCYRAEPHPGLGYVDN